MKKRFFLYALLLLFEGSLCHLGFFSVEDPHNIYQETSLLTGALTTDLPPIEVKQYVRSREMAFQEARDLFRSGYDDKAVSVLHQVDERDKESYGHWLFENSLRLAQQGLSGEGAFFMAASFSFVKYPTQNMLYNTGVAYSVSNQHSESTQYFAKALEINPGYVEARIEMIRSLILKGDLDKVSLECSRIPNERFCIGLSQDLARFKSLNRKKGSKKTLERLRQLRDATSIDSYSGPFFDGIVISLYTRDTFYRKKAQTLERSLKHFRIPYDLTVFEVKSRVKTIASKPEFILNKLMEHRCPVLFVDCDLELLKYPELLAGMKDIDFACLNRRQLIADVSPQSKISEKVFSGGLLYFNYTKNAMKLLKLWDAMVKYENENRDNDSVLSDLWMAFPDLVKNIRYKELPPEYTAFDTNPTLIWQPAPPDENSVFLHDDGRIPTSFASQAQTRYPPRSYLMARLKEIEDLELY